MFVWETWSSTGFAAAVVAWTMAVVLYRTAARSAAARRLALLLVIEGAGVVTAWGVPQLLPGPDAVRLIWLVHAATDFLLLALYPSFLARALDTPLTAPFHDKRLEAVLGATACAGILSVLLAPDLYVRAVIDASGSPVRWLPEPAPGGPVVWVMVGLMYVYALVAALQAWRRARSDVSRSRARAFALAFGIRDLFWAGSYLFLGLVLASGRDLQADQILVLSQLYVLPLILYVPLVAYGILKGHLFDLELKLKWTLERSTVAAAFIAVFFVVSEGAAALFSEWLGTVMGVAAAGMLVFVLAPLQRLAERVSATAMPGVRDTDEYRVFRKFQVYGAALESAIRDEEITARERRMLEALRTQLGIREEDAERLERQLQASTGSAARHATEPG